jgi:NADH-quinone oxidoreductase subunit N
MNSLSALGPLLAVVAGGIAALFLDAFRSPETGSGRSAGASLAFLAAAAGLAAAAFGRSPKFFGGALVLDDAAALLTLLLVLATAAAILLSFGTARRGARFRGEIYALYLFALAGTMIMVATKDLLVVFLGLEVFSVSAYALTAIGRTAPGAEAAAKYFLMGSVAGAFFVLGLAFLFGVSGSLDLAGIAAAAARTGLEPATIAGLGLIVAAFAFKGALVPFHMWAPDAYEGAPAPVAAFFSTAPKIAVFGVLFRLFAALRSAGALPASLVIALGGIAVLTSLWSSLAGLRQKNLKRLLAYSSICHSGYLVLAVLAGDAPGLLFYLTAYVFMSAGAFACVSAVDPESAPGGSDIKRFSGLGSRRPWLAAAGSVFLLSLSGFPPTAGFLGKFYIFSASIGRGHLGLVLAALLATLISVAFYLRVVAAMTMSEKAAPANGPESGAAALRESPEPALVLIIFFCLVAVLELGVFPGNILAFIRKAASF